MEIFQATELAHPFIDTPTIPLKTQAIVIDASPIYVEGLIAHLSKAGYQIVASLCDLASLNEHPTLFAGFSQPLCIIGPHLKTCEAFEACRRVRIVNGDVRVTLISQYADDPIFKADAAYSGALACLPITVMPGVLLHVLSIIQTGSSLIALEGQQIKVGNLSLRELEVLRLIAEGKTDPQIAEVLYLSVTTVCKHSQRILEKLEVNQRRDAIHRARHRGLL